MKTREKLTTMLTDNGFWPDEAEKVMALAISQIEAASLGHSVEWDAEWADESVYPQKMYAAWWLTVKQMAFKWIDENKPEAFFRFMFQ